MLLALVFVLTQVATAQPCPSPDAWAGPRPGQPVAPIALELARCVTADLDTYRWDDADGRLELAGAVDGLARQDALLWRGMTTRLLAARHIHARDWSALVERPAREWADVAWLGDLVTGLAEARLAWATQDLDGFARASAAARRLETHGRESGDLEVRRASLIVQAAVAGGQYEREVMQLLLDEAYRLEQQLAGALDGLSVPIVLARELEADLLLQSDRYLEAAERYREVLAANPRRVHSWQGFANAARRLGRDTEAADAEAVALRLVTEP